MKNYRLTSNLIAYLVPGKSDYIFIADTESKQHQTLVKKFIQNHLDITEYTEPIDISDNEFNVKFTNKFDVCIKSKDLPDPEKWYILGNMTKDINVFGEIISNIDNDRGDFGETNFEVAIDNKLEVVELVALGMPSYSEYLEEMRRQVNCSLYKKTKKWIPGHRYDTVKETIYFLGTVMSRRKDRCNSEWMPSDKMIEAYLVTNKLGDEKSISEVLKTRFFGTRPEDLKVVYSTAAMVDSGEVLKDDFNYAESQELIVNNGFTYYKTINEFGKINYNIPNILEPLGYTDVSDKNPDLSKYKTIVETILENEVLENLVNYWDCTINTRSDREINSKLDLDTNTSNCEKLLYYNIKDSNIMKTLYYQELFKIIGVNVLDLIKNKLNGWDIKQFIRDFDNFLKYGKIYSQNHLIPNNHSEKTARLRTEKSCNFKLELIPIENSIDKSTELYNVLVSMINFARDNYGMGVSHYSIANTGTTKLPKEFITVIVTLEDILKQYKTPLEIPENLKSDIVNYNFQQLTLTADKDIEIN